MITDEIGCAELLKILADRTRLGVVQLLLEKPHFVNEIIDNLHVEATLLSHHLKALRESGIVNVERRGRAMLYQLSPEVEASHNDGSIDLGCCQLAFGRKH